MNNTSILNIPFIIEHTFPFKIKLNLKLLKIFFLILIGILLGFYIFQVNDLALKTSQFQNSQREIKELSRKKEKLEVRVAELNSLLNVENLITKFNFEKAGKIHYIQISDTQIVKE